MRLFPWKCLQSEVDSWCLKRVKVNLKIDFLLLGLNLCGELDMLSKGMTSSVWGCEKPLEPGKCGTYALLKPEGYF